ncbi:hypothetical protein AB5N19_01623 [Seiridium cardinale]
MVISLRHQLYISTTRLGSLSRSARARRSELNNPFIVSTTTDVEGLVQDVESHDDDLLGYAKSTFLLGPLKSRVGARKLHGRTEDGQPANGSGNDGLAALVHLDLGDLEHSIALDDTSSNVGGQATDTGDDSLLGSLGDLGARKREAQDVGIFMGIQIDIGDAWLSSDDGLVPSKAHLFSGPISGHFTVFRQ